MRRYSLCLIFTFLLTVTATVVITILVRRGLAQDLFFDLGVLPLALLVLRVDFENIQSRLRLKFVVQRKLMHDLIFLLHQVELRRDTLLSLESRLSDRKQILDHELHALVNLSFVQDPAEALEDSVQTLRRELVQGVPTLFHEFDADFDAIIRRSGQQHSQQFQRDEFVHHLLVDEMR